MAKLGNLEKLAAMAQSAPKVEVPKEAKVIIPDMPVWIADKYAAIAVHGSSLISKRMMNIIGACFQVSDMNENDHHCRSILIRDDGEPQGDMAVAAYICKNMVLNLKRIFEVSTEEILENKEYSILFGWHRNMLLSTLHEINHLMLCHSAGEVDDACQLRRDEQADEWAWEKLVEMAKAIDIEPANYLEEPFFASAVTAWIEKLEEPLKSRQQHMLDNKAMLMIGDDVTTAKFVNSFKQVIHSMTDDPTDSEEWKKPPITMMEYVRDMGIGSSSSDLPGVDTDGFATTGNISDQVSAFAGAFTGTLPSTAPVTHTFQPAPASAPTGFAPVDGRTLAPATVPAQPAGSAIPNHNLPAEVISEAVKSVIFKAYNHIFANCGWVTHSQVPFSNPEKVCQPIALSDVEKQVVFAVDCMDEQGRPCAGAPTTDGLRGHITTKQKLPMYTIYINSNGKLMKRKLIPQNPATNSNNAKLAMDGTAIMYVMEGDPAIEQEMKKIGPYAHWYFKIINHEWTSMNNGL